MIEGSGTIGVDLGVGGLNVADNSRAVRLFKITSGTNPYTATEVVLTESSGTRDATGIYDVSSTRKELWEVNGNAAVKPGRVVIGHPNPAGLGLFFDADGLAPTARIPIKFCFTQSGGNLTGVKITWLNANGTTECEEDPICAGADCDDLWWCTTAGVVSYPPGTEPDPSDYYSGPYPTYALAVAACDADSGGPGEPGGGGVTCCTPTQTLNSSLRASLSGGHGSMTLTWNGTKWAGSKALSCGETLYIRYDTSCGLEYSCNGTTYASSSATGSSVDCGPPFVHTATWACDMDSVPLGCVAGSCGTINVTEVAE